MDALGEIPAGIEHLIVQLSIPIAYPRMNFLEYVPCQQHLDIIVLNRAKGCVGI